jgi:hypothetical protein
MAVCQIVLLVALEIAMGFASQSTRYYRSLFQVNVYMGTETLSPKMVPLSFYRELVHGSGPRRKKYPTSHHRAKKGTVRTRNT